MTSISLEELYELYEHCTCGHRQTCQNSGLGRKERLLECAGANDSARVETEICFLGEGCGGEMW